MKIGILGGTFNPIHLGHLILAEEAREKLGLERVIFVPAFLPPHKDNPDIASADVRLKMVKLAISGNKYFSCSDTEIKRDGRSYTIDTLKEFKKIYAEDELYFIIGSDLLTYLDEWRELSEIIKMVKFIVATRPGYPLDKIPSYIQTMPIRAVDISGYEIRNCIKEGRSFRYLAPEAVHKYILKEKLYKSLV
ncbi:MAG: nicotinate-nucleotide adenylyltransferase [Candidatus Omnitrophica bacterium]|nr:nicotinate-nucleotide adenylyltransferase [Candidatus Omnitrophota bacterium]MBU1090871.1 nicotinate-nucleotide adenylyltransferase [Candidatus Omnitrophota bacterium]MBU1905472.1 nicotinate-nucleotide adenylyltransferase [Candidatus Omnitrophota bacterium]